MEFKTERVFAAEIDGAFREEVRRREQAIADKLGQPLEWLRSRPLNELGALAAQMVLVEGWRPPGQPRPFVVLTKAEHEQAEKAGTLVALLR